MKIVKSPQEPEMLHKSETTVGEVYLCGSAKTPYLRCSDGFVELENGNYINFAAVRPDNCFEHAPNAKVVL